MSDNEVIEVWRDSPEHGPPPHDGENQAGLAAVLARRWLLIFAVTVVVGGGLCAAVWSVIKPRYEVAATFHVAPVVRPVLQTDVDTDISRQYREYVATQAQIVVSPAIVAAALRNPDVQKLNMVRGLADPTVLGARLNAEQIRGTHLVRVGMSGASGQEIATFVNKLVETYLTRQEDDQAAWVDKVLKSLRSELTLIEERITQADADMTKLVESQPSGSSDTAIDTRVAELGQQLTLARQEAAMGEARLEDLRNQEDIHPARIDPVGYTAFRNADPEWSGMMEMLRATVADNSSPGLRGTKHPSVTSKPERAAELRAKLREHEEEIKKQYREVLVQRLQNEIEEAYIRTQVVQDELSKLAPERAQISRRDLALDDLRVELGRLENTRSLIQQKIWNVELEQNRTARLTLESPASAPAVPNVDKRPKYMMAAVMFAGFLACVLALILDRRDTSVRQPDDVQDRIGLPLLGSVQAVPRKSQGMVLPQNPYLLDPIRRITTTLLAKSRQSPARSRMITSPMPDDGKSSLSLNLARTLASTNRRVLLIDGDNTGQGVTRFCGLKGRAGLMEVLDGEIGERDVIVPNHEPNLSVVPAGRRDERFGEFLIGKDARDIFARLCEGFDHVIVDSPPVLGCADTIAMATYVDEIVMVLRASKSKRGEAIAAQQYLRSVGANVIGVVLTGVHRKDDPYGSYMYGDHLVQVD